MSDHEKILECIYAAVDEVNELLPQDRQLHKSPDTVLFDRSAKLGSMDLLNLAVTAGEHVEEAFDVPVSLTDEKAISTENSPFRTIQTLVEFIATQLNENTDA
ncbi:MAG: hypothetical protein VYC17_01700 [Nitrospinota bacterium]|nr:hypothetical protein [Nitrospinota bacterium]